MAQIDFLAGTDFTIANLAGSGVGFYGDSGFGYSVAVGSYNGRSFITDSTGTAQGPEVDNNKWASSTTVIIGQAGSGISLLALPNYLTTLNIRFSHNSAVQTQNAKVYGYDRFSKNNNPSGVNLFAAQVVHPPNTQIATGSGNATWTNLKGSGTVLSLIAGPGVSGLSPNGTNTTATQHDWYLALSASPTSVGAKTFGLFFELEYL